MLFLVGLEGLFDLVNLLVERTHILDVSIDGLNDLISLLLKLLIVFLEGFLLLLEVFDPSFLLRNCLEKHAVVPFAVEEASNQILAVFDVSTASDFMVGSFYFLVLPDHYLHLVFQKFLQEEIGIANIDPLLLLLQFLAHRLHHNFFYFPIPLFPLDQVLVAPIQSIVERIDLCGPLLLLSNDCPLDGV